MLEKLMRLAALVNEHGEALSEWAELTNTKVDDRLITALRWIATLESQGDTVKEIAKFLKSVVGGGLFGATPLELPAEAEVHRQGLEILAGHLVGSGNNEQLDGV